MAELELRESIAIAQVDGEVAQVTISINTLVKVLEAWTHNTPLACLWCLVWSMTTTA
jgi:hypothetical protein